MAISFSYNNHTYSAAITMLQRAFISPVSRQTPSWMRREKLSMYVQGFRRAIFSRTLAMRLSQPHIMRLPPSHYRLLSTETRAAIDQAVASKPVVLFMKGTPETPQCGFSRASIQILGLQGVDPEKFSAFNVLEDQELRQGGCCFCPATLLVTTTSS